MSPLIERNDAEVLTEPRDEWFPHPSVETGRMHAQERGPRSAEVMDADPDAVRRAREGQPYPSTIVALLMYAFTVGGSPGAALTIFCATSMPDVTFPASAYCGGNGVDVPTMMKN